jgi:hypothetical protein
VVTRLRAEKAQPVEVVVGAGDALWARRPCRHLLPCPLAASALAGHVRGLLPRGVFLLVERIFGVIELVEGGTLLLPEDHGPYLSAS